METISPVAADDSSGANPSSVKSDDSSPRHESGRGSPPPNCAICLGTCRNKSFTDSCLHQFCFKCLLTWSKVKAECPLCKQNFKSIIHNVRSNHQYEEYMVEQRETEEPIERLDLENPIIQATRRFRYRTTMTLPRRDSLAIQQLLLQYPMAGLVAGAALPARRRRSSASFRRTVYRHRLWARPLPDFTGRFRDCSPHFYRYNEAQMHRLVAWVNRELHYLLNENIGHINYVRTIILELFPRYHINSPEFRDAVRPYFRDRTEHFLHELYCFASSPYDMTGYDRNVQYTTDTRISTMINEVISSSESEASADSDIVMVSSSEPAEPPAGPSRAAGPSRVPQPVYPQNYISEPAADGGVIPIETISQSDTDDDSSEVLVVGYIKPPQDRTPEVVDLLGSDSDVIVQDTVPAEPAAAEPAAGRVKLVLKRHVSRDESDSDDSTYQPPARRRRRLRSAGDAATPAGERSPAAPPPPPAPPASPTPPPLPAPPTPSASSSSSVTSPSAGSAFASASSGSAFASTSSGSIFASASSSSSSSTSSPSSSSSSTTSSTPSSDSFSDIYSDSSSVSSPSGGRRTKVSKRKSRRKIRKSNGATAKNKKKSSSKKRPSRPRKKDKLSKRKSRSSRGTKSSKKNGPTDVPSERRTLPLDQPSTSGISSTTNSHNSNNNKEKKRRRESRESRRLKSVVNVMYNKRKEEESSSNVTCNITNSAVTNSSPTTTSTASEGGLPVLGPTAVAVETRDYEDSDWDDDLPLNLTMQKTFHSL